MTALKSLGQRILVIGNSGSGKSALSARLAALIHVPVVDLDFLHWEAGGSGRKRDEATARRMVSEVASQIAWIIEGVYGWLAEMALSRATTLIWLDLPWSVCQTGLRARGPSRGATEQDVADLLKWAEQYWQRQTSTSFAGHARMFEDFSGTKFRLQSREDVRHLLRSLGADPES
jgi:adenylate kinase family enzyme